MQSILLMLSKINICYVILNLLCLITAFLFLKRNQVPLKTMLILLTIYIIATFFSFSYLNGITNSIFKLKFLSVKAYLLLMITINLVILYTINHPVKSVYKALNYLLFIIETIILGATISIVLGNRFDEFYIMDISNAVNFIDLSFVLFILYVILSCIVYIGYYLFSPEDFNSKTWLGNKLKETHIPDIPFSNIHLPKFTSLSFPKRKNRKNKNREDKKYSGILSPEELLHYNKEDGFYINGVECSIIFEDSNQENIIKNYYILLEDIHARLVNGYTLEENLMLKSICMKLNVGNLGNIDLNNVGILNRISVEEYNLLKRVFGNH